MRKSNFQNSFINYRKWIENLRACQRFTILIRWKYGTRFNKNWSQLDIGHRKSQRIVHRTAINELSKVSRKGILPTEIVKNLKKPILVGKEEHRYKRTSVKYEIELSLMPWFNSRMNAVILFSATDFISKFRWDWMICADRWID